MKDPFDKLTPDLFPKERLERLRCDCPYCTLRMATERRLAREAVMEEAALEPSRL